MQILSKQFSVSQDEIKHSPRAARLLSPIVPQLDLRAFEKNHALAGPGSILSKLSGLLVILLIAIGLMMVNWLLGSATNPTNDKTELSATQIPPTRIDVPEPLDISSAKLRKITINRKSIALVSGQIINRSGNKMSIPKLNIVLRGKDGQNVTSWRHRLPQTYLMAGASVSFSSNRPTDVNSDSVVEIQFVSGDER